MFTRSRSKRHQLAVAAREAVDTGANSTAELETYVRQAASEAEEVLRDSARSVRQRSGEAYRDLVDVVHDYPVATIAIACAFGALVAFLLKR